ncbi:CopG domain protein DNA-binding domain protein [Desulfarculus baarsii DSM 2075]|uniref:CopG domain protein DNA-binding domain protein n=1 Tax=Desulfarculus baarsii (strain ATCC 33931 / DSM 2075 / LMG 7858 / VKM B-1802 / 2st14) TaxID=644282 RepID=E1QH20_DESB2|nr:ribbon-helix-helix protein, CopG family [Desulfarculus baarsii]ADK84863.1 CopG domain protein DNA-binding domain protein [Desulfarculus baarsii DSM 2075]
MAKRARLSQLKKDLDQARPTPPGGLSPAAPAIRKTDKSTTPGGLLRRTIYVTEAEWAALLERSYTSGQSVSEIIRQAVRQRLGLDQE